MPIIEFFKYLFPKYKAIQKEESLSPENNERFTFFYHGPFCQWYKSPFVLDGISYNCAEQYMMAEKARLFGDHQILARIMKANDPYDQKELGKKVKNFDQKTWDMHKYNIVKKANLAKFEQNPELLLELAKTQGTTLVEASPFDQIWGIGLRILTLAINRLKPRSS